MLLAKAVNKRINELCSEFEIKPKALADLSQVPLTTIMDVLKLDTVCPTLPTIARICRAFPIELVEFFDSPYFKDNTF